MVRLFIDADACPVKEECLEIAARHGAEAFIVSNTGLRPSRDPMVHVVMVGKGFDEADDWIAERAGPGDVTATADVPLAVRLVAKGVLVTNFKGRVFEPGNIGMASAMRDLGQALDEAGTIRRHTAPFSARDRSQFRQVLDKLMRQAARNASGPNG